MSTKYRITTCSFKRNNSKKYERGFYVYRWTNNTVYILDKNLNKVEPPYACIRDDEHKNNVIFDLTT